MEEKLNMKYQHFPTYLHQIKNIFFDLLDEKAKDIIAMKVAKRNGDIRIAFDLIKTSLSKLYEDVK
jgi:Cdc6-like AAA superfamily ATPase